MEVMDDEDQEERGTRRAKEGREGERGKRPRGRKTRCKVSYGVDVYGGGYGWCWCECTFANHDVRVDESRGGGEGDVGWRGMDGQGERSR